MKKEKQDMAIKLRTNGVSVRTIAKELNVSPSSVSGWVKNVILTDEQIKILQSKSKGGRFTNKDVFNYRVKYSNERREIRKEYQDIGREMYRLNEKDFSFCCALYLGEGAKERNSLKICNTDVNLLKLFYHKFPIQLILAQLIR